MMQRLIDGYLVFASTDPVEPGAAFYEPALKFRPEGEPEGSEHTHVPWTVTSQDVESRTQEEALQLAQQLLSDIEAVRWYGNQWDLRFN